MQTGKSLPLLSLIIIFFASPFLASVYPGKAAAYEITNIPESRTEGILVYPNKFEFELGAGEKAIKEIRVANQSNDELNFDISFEDFILNEKAEEKIQWQGSALGKNYIKPEINNFILKPNEQIIFKVEIKINSEDNLFTALMVNAKKANSESAVGTMSRVAVLFMVAPEIRLLSNALSPDDNIKRIILGVSGLALIILLIAGFKIMKRDANMRIHANDTNIKKKGLISLLILALSILTIQPVFADLKSENYKILREAVDVGGTDRGRSESYQIIDTAGEAAAGNIAGSNYNLKAGFLGAEGYPVVISTPSDVTMTGCTQSTNCVSTGSVSWTITTENPTGYTLNLSASTDPALKSGSNSFSNFNYSPRFWSVDSNASAFGFAIGASGQTDILTTFKDNGTTCGTGSNLGSCYRGFNGTGSVNIVSRSTAAASGNATTVKFKAEIGLDKGQSTGSYTAAITATAAAL